MELLQIFLLAAFLAEAVTESLKKVFVEKKIQWSYVISIGAGALIAIATQLDIFEVVGIELLPSLKAVGYVSSALVFARGSNWVHDFLGRITKPESAIEFIPETEEINFEDEGLGEE